MGLYLSRKLTKKVFSYLPLFLMILGLVYTYSTTSLFETDVDSTCSINLQANLQSSAQITLGEFAETAKANTDELYTWRNVDIRGMGFVTGVLAHSQERDLVYVRTDVGGIYRWQGEDHAWMQLLDNQRNRYNIESFALDPQQPDALYAAANGVMLRSQDRGQSWQETPLVTPTEKPVFMDGNGEWRWAGERLVVDPHNSQVLYFGSRQDGLYRSWDGGVTWQQVTSFPTVGTAPGGIMFVVFDPKSELRTDEGLITPMLYAGVMGVGVYGSQDGGQYWQRLSPGPGIEQKPQQGVVTADGSLYVSYFTTVSDPQGSVWRYHQGQGQDVTPHTGRNYSAIAADPIDPATLLVAEYPLSPQGLHRSTDGGKHWQMVSLRNQPVRWWPDWHLYTLTGGLAINPKHPEQVWLTTGFGVLHTEDIAQRTTQWCAPMKNLEELVVFVLKHPPVADGAALFSGVADIHGFRHQTLIDHPQTTYENSSFGDTTGLDFAEADPNIIVRVGSAPGRGGRTDSNEARSAYSSDNGRTWRTFAHPPAGAVNGKVAVSATVQDNGYPIIVWAPQGEVYPHRSLDGGATWESVSGAPNRTTLQLWFPSQAVASDRVDGNLFYLYKYTETANQATLYRSTDGGKTWWPAAQNLPDSYEHSVKAVPQMRGEVWLRAAGQLLRSSDAGSTLIPIDQVEHVDDFTFGKAAPGAVHPTVFVSGRINGVDGLFRSDDLLAVAGSGEEATWFNLATPDQTLSSVNYLEGDRLQFGHVYAGTGGRGILHGYPNF